MPISSKHPEVEKNEFQWRKCRDCVEGEDAVKAGGHDYLPMLGGQDGSEYESYKQRAVFFSASGRTVKGLAGAILRKEPVLEFPVPPFLLDVGARGETIGHVIKNATEELISTGRLGIMVDSDAGEDNPNGQPYLSIYYPENIINWGEQMIGGRLQLTMLVLLEDSPIQDNESDDPFVWEEDVERYRVLTLEDWDTPTPHLHVEVWEKSEEADDNKNPNANKNVQAETPGEVGPYAGFTKISEVDPAFMGGKPVPYIPFVIINPGQCGPEVEPSPILDLVNTNLAHYRNSADLEHGMHFTALPQPYITGVEDASSVVRIGSETAWTLANPDAKAAYLEFSGAGLSAIREEMQRKEEKMAILGARMLEAQKADAEAAQTVQLRHSGEESVLSSIVDSLAEGFTKALTWLAEWIAQPDQKISVELNKDFNALGLDSPTIQQLMFAAQGALISWDTFFYNMKRGEYIPDGRTAEEEKAMIEIGNPQSPTMAAGGAGGMGAGGPPAKGGGGGDQGSPD